MEKSQEINKMRRFAIKRNTAIKKWHSRSRLIDIRKTKITFVMLEEPRIANFDMKIEREDEVIATSVAVISGTGEIRQPCMQGFSCPGETEEQVDGTPVEVLAP
jgi:hypothetical protein